MCPENLRAPVFSRDPDKEGFSPGRVPNVKEVFGNDWKTFRPPIFSSFGDGLSLSYSQRFVDEDQGSESESEEEVVREEVTAPSLWMTGPVLILPYLTSA